MSYHVFFHTCKTKQKYSYAHLKTAKLRPKEIDSLSVQTWHWKIYVSFSENCFMFIRSLVLKPEWRKFFGWYWGSVNQHEFSVIPCIQNPQPYFWPLKYFRYCFVWTRYWNAVLALLQQIQTHIFNFSKFSLFPIPCVIIFFKQI